MPVNFLEIRSKVKEIGEQAPQRLKELNSRREQARQWLGSHAAETEELARKVALAAGHDSFLRAAVPLGEPLNAAIPTPQMTPVVTVLAADGSQIPPDRHSPIYFYLVNVGAIQIAMGGQGGKDPKETVETELVYDTEITGSGVSNTTVNLKRDINERQMLARLVEDSHSPVITLTDGPLELWGNAQNEAEQRQYQEALKDHLAALKDLQNKQAITAGYVDKPRVDMVVRLLEIAAAPSDELNRIKDFRPLLGVTDADLYRSLLQPGARSAVFAIQSQAARSYQDALALHFFYLNVGRENRPWLARVEIPAWVALDTDKLDILHAVLVAQCRILGARHYPYVLHRSHEIAVVSREETAQIISMIQAELQEKGIDFGEESQKQAVKGLAGRRRFNLGKRSY